MKSSRWSAIYVAAAVIGALAVGQADAANVITGQMWHVPDAIAQSATPANVPGRGPDVTFDVTSPLDFDSPGTVQSFLSSGGAFNVIENTPGTLTSLISDGAVSTLMNFVGVVTVTTGQQFTVTHDDGLTLVIGGLNLGFSTGPTAPTTSTATYNGPSGTLPFQLVYGECCSGSAVLQVDLPFTNAVPEPASLLLFLFGAVALQLHHWKFGKVSKVGEDEGLSLRRIEFNRIQRPGVTARETASNSVRERQDAARKLQSLLSLPDTGQKTENR